MIIEIRIKPGSKENSVKKIGKNSYEFRIKALPQKGEANKELLKQVSYYFKLPVSSVKIKKGHTSKIKLLELID